MVLALPVRLDHGHLSRRHRIQGIVERRIERIERQCPRHRIVRPAPQPGLYFSQKTPQRLTTQKIVEPRVIAGGALQATRQFTSTDTQQETGISAPLTLQFGEEKCGRAPSTSPAL